MAVLFFEVQADYEEVIKCKEKIADLQKQADSFSANTPTKEIAAWQNKLRTAQLELKQLVSKAAQAGAEMEHSLVSALDKSKQKASEMANAQKDAQRELAETEKELKRLNDELVRFQKAGDNKEVQKYQSYIAHATSLRDEAQVSVDDATSNLTQAQDELEQARQALDDFRESAGETSRELRQTQTEATALGQEGRVAMQSAQLHAQQTNKVMSMMPAPIKEANAKFQSLRATLKTIENATGILKILALIALALESLHRWITRTSEGEEAFAKVQGAVTGALDGVLTIVDKVTQSLIDFCKAVKNAFDTGTLKEFGQSLANDIWEELKRIGGIFVSLGSWIKTGFTEGWSSDATSSKLQELKDAINNSKVVQAAEAAGEDIGNGIKNGIKKAEAEVELKRLTAKYTRAIASIDKQIAEEQSKMSRATATTTEKLKSQEKILDLIRRKENMNVALASKKLALSKKNASFDSLSSSLQQEVADAEKQYLDAKSKQESAISSAEESLRRLQEQELAEMQRRADMNETMSQKYTREQVDLIYQQTQLEIDAMAEGSAKKMRQRQLDYEKEKEQLKRQFEDEQKEAMNRAEEYWRLHNPGKEWTEGVITRPEFHMEDIDEETRDIYNEIMDSVRGRYEIGSKKLDAGFVDVSDIVNQYKSVDQKRRELDEDYAFNRMMLEQAIASYIDKLNRGIATSDDKIKLADMQGALEEMDKSHINAVIDLDVEDFQKRLKNLQQQPVYFAAMQDASLLSTKTIEDFNAALESNRQALSELPPDQLRVITDLMDKLADVSINRNPYEAMRKASFALSNAQIELIEKQELYNEALRKQEEAQQKINEAQAAYDLLKDNPNADNNEKELALTLLEDWQKALLKTKNEISTSKNAVDNAVANVFAKTNQLEKANSAILNQVSKMSGKFKALGSLIGGMNLGTKGEIFQKIAESVASIMDAIVEVNQIAKEVNDANLVNMEVQAANTNSSAASVMLTASQNMQSAANNINSKAGETPVQIPNAGKTSVGMLGKASAIMQGAQIGMTVGSSLVNLFDSIINTGQEKYEKFRDKINEVNKLTDSIKRYHRSSLLAQQAEDSWFGNSPLRNLQNQWEVAQQSQKNYYDKLKQRQAAYRNQSKHDGDWFANVVVGTVIGAGVAALSVLTAGAGAAIAGATAAATTTAGAASATAAAATATAAAATSVTAGAIASAAAIGGVVGGATGAAVSALEQGLLNSDYDEQTKRAIDNLRIETRAKKSSFMWIGGHDQETADLRSWVKEKYGEDLFDPKTNQINIELAEEVIATYGDKLQGETQATMEEMIELAKQYEEYQDALKEYVNSLYSPLTDNMTDAIWAWFDEGRDALSAFRESASSTFRSIVNDLMKQIVLKNIVGTFQDDIKELYDKFNAGEMDQMTLIRQVSLKTKDMTEAYEQSVPLLQEMATTMSDTIEDITGVSIADSGGGASSSGGAFSGMNQDVGNEMNGRLTAIQIGVDNIEGGLNTLTVNSMAMLNYASEQSVAITGIQQQIATSYLELQGIHEDTSSMVKSMKDMNEYMYNWDSHVKKL